MERQKRRETNNQREGKLIYAAGNTTAKTKGISLEGHWGDE